MCVDIKAMSNELDKYSVTAVPTALGYRCECLELDTSAEGKTFAVALRKLKAVNRRRLRELTAQGLPIPAPYVEPLYSGQTRLRLDKDIHKKAALMADREGVSLNTYIVSAVAESIGYHQAVEDMRKRFIGVSAGTDGTVFLHFSPSAQS